MIYGSLQKFTHGIYKNVNKFYCVDITRAFKVKNTIMTCLKSYLKRSCTHKVDNLYAKSYISRCGQTTRNADENDI